MPNERRDAFYDQLIQHGIALPRAARIACELQDHYEDLEREALGAGLNAEDARREARSRIGELEAIAKCYELRPELKQHWNAWPRALHPIFPNTCYALLSSDADAKVFTRWCVSACCGTLLTSTLLFVLQLVVLQL